MSRRRELYTSTEEAPLMRLEKIGRGNRRYRLNDLFVIEVLAESLHGLLVNAAPDVRVSFSAK